MTEVEIFMVASVNKKIHKKILLIHADWLKDNGYKKEYKNCLKQANELKRTGVQIMPRAIPCTSSCDPERGSLGAFAPAGVRARKLWGFG